MNLINTGNKILFNPKCIYIYFTKFLFKNIFKKTIIYGILNKELRQFFFPFHFAFIDYIKYYYMEYETYSDYLREHFNLSENEFSKVYSIFLLFSQKTPIISGTSFVHVQQLCFYINDVFDGDFRYEN